MSKIKTAAKAAGNTALSILMTTALQMLAEAAAKRMSKKRQVEREDAAGA